MKYHKTIAEAYMIDLLLVPDRLSIWLSVKVIPSKSDFSLSMVGFVVLEVIFYDLIINSSLCIH